MSRKQIGITEEQIKYAYTKATNAAAAAKILGVHPSSFKRYAVKFGLYTTNQGGKGEPGRSPATKRSTDEILQNGIYTPSSRLKERLLKEGLIKNECGECKLKPFWNQRPLTLQLDHIDGDNQNNERSNLRLLCPNCHSQTPTYCRGQGKNKRSW